MPVADIVELMIDVPSRYLSGIAFFDAKFFESCVRKRNLQLIQSNILLHRFSVLASLDSDSFPIRALPCGPHGSQMIVFSL